MVHRVELINDIGLQFKAEKDNEHLRVLRVFVESGTVHVEVVVKTDGSEDGTIERLQYLSPTEAMAFAKAFERCAIAAFKESA